MASARGDDFVALAEHLTAGSRLNLTFVLPQAPGNPRCFGQAAWWDIDVQRWVGAMQMGEQGVAALIRDEPSGLPACRESLGALVAEADALLGSADKPLLLGGFSQGAMTAMDLALHLPEARPAAGVLMFSGAPIVVDQWSAKLAAREKERALKVLVTHGQADPVLPFAGSGWVRDLLQQGGATVQYHSHAGGHELGGPTVLGAAVDFVRDAVPQQA